MSLAEDDFWKAKVLEARHGQLEVVRKATAGWTALFASVLGVFGTVSFVGGFSELDDFDDKTALIARSAVCLAALLTLVATIVAGLAANSLPTSTDNSTFQNLRDGTKLKAEAAVKKLSLAMKFGVAAAVVVLVGGGYVTFVGKDEPTAKPPKVTAVVGGVAVCGELIRKDGGLSVDGTPLTSVEFLVVVDACPS